MATPIAPADTSVGMELHIRGLPESATDSAQRQCLGPSCPAHPLDHGRTEPARKTLSSGRHEAPHPDRRRRTRHRRHAAIRAAHRRLRAALVRRPAKRRSPKRGAARAGAGDPRRRPARHRAASSCSSGCAQRATCRWCFSPRAATRSTAWSASSSAPTTTSPSRSRRASWWRACARCCGAPQRRAAAPADTAAAAPVPFEVDDGAPPDPLLRPRARAVALRVRPAADAGRAPGPCVHARRAARAGLGRPQRKPRPHGRCAREDAARQAEGGGAARSSRSARTVACGYALAEDLPAALPPSPRPDLVAHEQAHPHLHRHPARLRGRRRLAAVPAARRDIDPRYRESAEESLVETAHLMASARRAALARRRAATPTALRAGVPVALRAPLRAPTSSASRRRASSCA